MSFTLVANILGWSYVIGSLMLFFTPSTMNQKITVVVVGVMLYILIALG